MNDLTPPAWTVSEWTQTDWTLRDGEPPAYSIESILPKDRRRFLRIHEPFMLLTGNSLIRAALLECVLFETARRLRQDDHGELRDLEWRETQYRLLTGPDPETCDLWAPVSDRLLRRRLLGLADNPRTVTRAFAWLEDHGYVLRRRLGGSRNDRLVLTNIGKIDYDQKRLPRYGGRRVDPPVSGSPDQLLSRIEAVPFTPLYEGLVEVVRATGLDGSDACRAALLLQRILHRAALRSADGQEVAVRWGVEDMRAALGWGGRSEWSATLKTLISSGLLLRAEDRRVEPNLVKLHQECGTLTPSALNQPNPYDQSAKSVTPYSQIRTTNQPDPEMSPAKSGNDSFIDGTESLTESLLRKSLGEREPPEITPELWGQIEKAASLAISGRREQEFRASGARVPVEWAQLTFLDVADQADRGLAAVLYRAADQLARGRRVAECLRDHGDLSRASVCVMIGSWVDRGLLQLNSCTVWIRPGEHRSAVEKPFQDPGRQQLVDRLREPPALVIENLVEAGANRQLRDLLVEAIRSARSRQRPILFLGLPDTVGELRAALKEDRLVELVVECLTEERPDPDGSTGGSSGSGDPLKPFAGWERPRSFESDAGTGIRRSV